MNPLHISTPYLFWINFNITISFHPHFGLQSEFLPSSFLLTLAVRGPGENHPTLEYKPGVAGWTRFRSRALGGNLGKTHALNILFYLMASYFC
jgi:hypothetical protein